MQLKPLISMYLSVYTLQERCFQILRWLIPKDQVKNLEIPRMLQIDLIEYFTAFVTALAYSQRGNSIIPNPLLRQLDPSGSASGLDPTVPVPVYNAAAGSSLQAATSVKSAEPDTSEGCKPVASTSQADNKILIGASKLPSGNFKPYTVSSTVSSDMKDSQEQGREPVEKIINPECESSDTD